MINTDFFNQFPVLETKRLVLRAITPDDTQAIYALRNNPRVKQFIARPDLPNLPEAENFVAKIMAAFTDKKAIGWAGQLKSNGQFIGACGFNKIDFSNHWAELGGELAVEQWGKFIAFEAVQAILNFGFINMGLHSVEAKVQPGNCGAIYLLEKFGFKKEAHFTEYFYFENKYHDLAVYRLVNHRQHT